MANAWFRMYAEWGDDPKVQMMPEVMQRRLAMLFCNRCKGETLHETQRAFHWRITPAELAETKQLFITNGFMDEDWNLLNWNRRQFISDSSTERVRRHRQASKQNETLHEKDETIGNVTVTAPDTEQIQNRTEQRHKKPLAPSSGEDEPGVFALPLPGKQGDWQLPQALYGELVELHPGVTVMAELAKMRTWLLTNPSKRKTRRGMAAFIGNWLSKAQNDSKNHTGGTNGRNNGKPNRADEIRASTLAAFGGQNGMAGEPYRGGRVVDAGPGPHTRAAPRNGAPVGQNPLGDW